MRCVGRPDFDARETFTTCIGRIRDTRLKQRLENVTDFIASEAASYADLAATASLHRIAQTNDVLGLVTTDEMVALYDQRMASADGPSRHIYDAIKGLPKHGICPFCDHRTVSTLDHILPKRLFPTFTVAPDNLVGACADCNRSKLVSAPTMAGDAVLHPYFDEIETERWLDACVVEGPVAALRFRTKVVPAWSRDLNERIRRQFRMLGLAKLYGAQAARMISDLALLLERIHKSRGGGGVKEELACQAETREAVHLNSWQAVTYRSLCESDWFCNGGFRTS